MGDTYPQFHKNELDPIKLEKTELTQTLVELRAAVTKGVEQIQNEGPCPDASDPSAYGHIFSGALGISLMYLRLDAQSSYLNDDVANESFTDFCVLARGWIPKAAAPLNLQPGRPSPIASPTLGASVMRILAGTPTLPRDLPSDGTAKDDFSTLNEAVDFAIKSEDVVDSRGHAMGTDEVLYGRAGVLWALSCVQQLKFQSRFDIASGDEARRKVEDISTRTSELVDVMVEAGIKGSKAYALKHGEDTALALMWPWLDEYYSLGAMHGITGILTTLLNVPTADLEPSHIPLIASSIKSLCDIAIAHNGHLPLCIPPWPHTARSSPLVQLCHGAPGLLLLLATARKHNILLTEQWDSTWDAALKLCAQRVWEEGLLGKGGCVCHGIAGNAWPFLLLHEGYAYPLRNGENANSADISKACADEFLAKGLAFLLEARRTTPFANSETNLRRYRTPDAPFCLFEGLAGTVCAWAEACAIVERRLMWMEIEEERRRTTAAIDENFLSRRRGALGMIGFEELGR